MRKLKVLHVLATTKEEFFINNLISYTDPADIEFSFVSLTDKSRFTESIKERGLHVYAVNVTNRIDYLRAALSFRKILASESPDIVHTHLFGPTLMGLTVAKKRRLKVVVTRHHSDAIHRIPSPTTRAVYLKLENYINKNADHLIAPSKMVRECLVEWEKAQADKVSIIPYGQTSERFDGVNAERIRKKRDELGMGGQLSLVCVSRLYEQKGQSYLFEAVAALKRKGIRAKLYLVGSGEYRSHLEYLVNQMEISDRVEFLGWRDDTIDIIAAADLIVHPSLEDALSQSLIESLMLARPIVATDISGASDTLGNGQFGRLVPPGDAESLREAIEETIVDLKSAEIRAQLGREHILEYMNAQRVADEHLRIYRKVV